MAITSSTLKMIMAAEDRATNVLNKVGGSVAGLAGVVGKTLVAGLAAGGVAAGTFIAKAISAGSDAEEMVSKFNAVFGDVAGEFEQKFDAMGNDINRNRFELMEWASTLQDTFVPMGFARDEAAQMSLEMTALAVDVASFNNTLEADTVRDFQSALVGNHETVRKYGIVITQTTLDQKLMEMGIKDGIAAATEQQKVMARQALIMEGTSDAHGDAAKTAGSWANQMRGLQATLSETFTEIGSKLLPVFTPLLQRFAEMAKNAAPAVIALFENKLIPAIESIVNLVQMLISGDFQGGIFGLTEDHPLIGFFLGIRENAIRFWDFITGLDLGGVFKRFLGGSGGQLRDFFQNLATKIMPKVLEVKQKISDWWEQHGPGIQESAGRIFGKIREVFTQIAEDAIPFFLGIIDKVTLWFEENGPLIEEFLAKLAELWENNIGPAILSFWEAVKPVLGALVDTILGIAKVVMQIFTGDWAGAWETVKEIFSGAWEAIKEFAKNAIDGILKLFGGNLEQFITDWTDIWEQFKRIINEALDKVKQWVDTKINNILDPFRRLKDKIGELRDMVGNLGKAFLDFVLPDVLTPGSPTPFETGLVGINRALDKLSGASLPRFNAQISGAAGAGVPALAGVAAGGGAAGGPMINVTIEHRPLVSLNDRAEAQTKMIELIRGAVREILRETANSGSQSTDLTRQV